MTLLRRLMGGPLLALSVLVSVSPAVPGAPAQERGKAKAPKPAPEALKAFNAALQLLRANQVDPAIEKLRALVRDFPQDPLAEKAKALLIENGVAEEFRVQLFDRQVFREKLKIPEKDVLEMEEKILKELRFRFKGLKPYFQKADLRLLFYDSQARYREQGGLITASGHFGVNTANYKSLALEGKVEWYFPREAGSQKDRLLFMKGLLYHETTHYLNAIQFAAVLPSVLDEGIATYFQSRLNTDYYQAYRQTDRERLEENARNGLNTIAKYDGFLRLLDSTRGFGQGDLMVSRWYGLSYAVVDFLAEGEVQGKKGSLEKLLEALTELTQAHLKTIANPVTVPKLSARPVLETLADRFYGKQLPEVHQELVKYIMARYRKR